MEKPGAYRSIARIEEDGAIVPRSKGLNSWDYDALKRRAVEIATRRALQVDLFTPEGAPASGRGEEFFNLQGER